MPATKYRFRKKIPFFSVIGIIGFVFLVFALKVFSTPHDKVYAKVKLSQGFWWATTAKPNIWLARAINAGDIEKDLLGNDIAKVLEVRHYPYFSDATLYEDKYDVYLTLELTADYKEQTGEVIFKRSSLSVGSPIELLFPSSQITGTVIEISREPFQDKYVEKNVTLIKKEGYTKDNPFFYDSIYIGDKYFDGKENVFEITGKKLEPTSVSVSDLYGNIKEREISSRQDIIINAKVLARQDDSGFYFGQENLLSPGGYLTVLTQNLKLEELVIAKVN